MTHCARCTELATHRVTLTLSSGRKLEPEALCDDHTRMESTLRDTGLSMATVTIEKLPEQ